MKVIVGMATFSNRPVEKAIQSLLPQVDKIVLYDNENPELPNLTDNGKFFVLTQIDEPCYVFLCDDDLLYPKDYIKRTIAAIEKYNCIITHHGRKIKKLDVPYYGGHFAISCKGHSNYTGPLHVAGTGVTAFRSDYFSPENLHEANDKLMSDLVFSLEAAKQNKVIRTIPHQRGWIKQIPIDASTSCQNIMKHNQQRPIEVANEIFCIFNPN